MSDNRNVSESQSGNKAVVIQGDNYAPINAASPEEDSSWLEKISQENPAYHKKRIFESKGSFFPESFRWILGHEDFNRWRNTDKSGVFWIKGDPGKGKTMLLGGLVDHFKEIPGTINLAYFFCQATDSRINTAVAVIGGLIVSFIKQYHELRSYIRTTYEDELDKLNGPDRWYILRDIFEKVTQHPALSCPICVVDALDECEQEHGCKQLLRLITETSCRVKWLISSRNITEIERELQGIDSDCRLSLELKENADYVTKSADLYINNSIQSIAALKDDEELLIKATHTLKSKANGTFLWVALVIEQLRDTKHRNVEAVLNELPEGLDNLYNLILKRLAKQEDKDAYQVMLSTITAAERPLRLEELFTFISFQWKHCKTTYSLRDIQDIVKDCGSFLSIRDDDKSVYFIHQSVKDYMMGTAFRVIFPSGIEYQHYKMFTTSLSAMSRILKHNIYNVQDPNRHIEAIFPPNPDPLAPIAYCCVFWVEHLFRSCESGASRDKIFLKDGKTLHKFLKDKYLCWLETLALLRCLVPQGIDAIQKLRILLPGYVNRGHGHEMANLRREREKSRHRFRNHYKDSYLGKYIIYAYTVFNYFGDSQLTSFINDAYHFFYFHKELLGKYPLQLYYSAITFENTHSAIYTTFQQVIRTEFKDAPTSITMPQRKFSLIQTMDLGSYYDVIALLYSPDSSFLCSLTSGGTISLFRTHTYTLERVIELEPDKKNNDPFFLWNIDPHFLAFSMDSKHLVSISNTGVVQAWAVNGGFQMQKYSLKLSTSLVPRPGDSPFAKKTVLQEEVIALSRCGELAASIYRTLSGTVDSVKIWTIKAEGCSIVIDQLQHMLDNFHAVFSPNSEMIALIDKKSVHVYFVQTGEFIKHVSCPTDSTSYLRAREIYSRFSPDSKFLALKYDNSMCLWCTETWEMIREINFNYKFQTREFDLSSNAALSICKESRELILESMDTGETLLNLKPHGWVENLIFPFDWTQSSLFASSIADTVQIWRVHKERRAKSSKLNDTASDTKRVAISPKSKYVAVCNIRGNIEIWSGESGECIQVLPGEGRYWSSTFFSPDLERVASVQKETGDIQIWHVKTGKPLHLLKGPGAECYNVQTDFSDDSRYIIAGYQTDQARVWCVECGKCLYETRFDDDTIIGKVAFCPSSKNIAMAPGLDDGIPTELKRESSTSASLTFSLNAKVFVVITATKSSHRFNKASFYDIVSGACLSHVDTGESNCFPYFDPAKDHLVSVRFRFCKMSSEEGFNIIPEPKEYCFREGEYGERWICRGERKVFQIPKHTYLPTRHMHPFISDSLLAFINTAGEVIIVKLPVEQ